jgi:hypothetical protein
MARKNNKQEELVGFVGVGLDNEDGHTRVTKSEYFVLVGGSSDTHEQMQDTAIYFNEALDKKGKRLPETETHEAIELLRDAIERSRRRTS